MDLTQLFGFELILMRMSGFIFFNPLFGRNNVSFVFKVGFSFVLALFIMQLPTTIIPQQPQTVIQLALVMIIELSIGFTLSFVMRMFFSIVQLGGDVMDTQMGLTMSQIYDSSSGANMTVTSSYLNVLFLMVFFAENGHYTMMRILITAGEIVPYGTAAFGNDLTSHITQIFFSYIILSVKLALPVLGAQLIGVIGMGILMKAIPQINAFVINMELKVIVGYSMLFMFFMPISEFMLLVEVQMLNDMQSILQTLSGIP